MGWGTDRDDILRRLRDNDPTLTSLDLNCNGIGDAGGQALADGLKTNTTLATLDLFDNRIGDAGGQAFAEMLKTNATLTYLGLMFNGIGDPSGKALADGLKTNTTLTELNLDNTGIGDAGGKALADVLNTNTTLKVLVLNRNEIGDAGGKALAEMLKTNTTLVKLYLISNGICEQLERDIKFQTQNNKVRAQKQQIADLRQQKAEARQLVSELRKQLEMAHEENARSRQQIADLQQQIANLQQQQIANNSAAAPESATSTLGKYTIKKFESQMQSIEHMLGSDIQDTVHRGVIEGFKTMDQILSKLCQLRGKGGHGMGQYLGQLTDIIPKSGQLNKNLQAIINLRNPEAHVGGIHYSNTHGWNNLEVIEELMVLLQS